MGRRRGRVGAYLRTPRGGPPEGLTYAAVDLRVGIRTRVSTSLCELDVAKNRKKFQQVPPHVRSAATTTRWRHGDDDEVSAGVGLVGWRSHHVAARPLEVRDAAGAREPVHAVRPCDQCWRIHKEEGKSELTENDY